MQTDTQSGRVLFVSNRTPEPAVAEDIEAHGLVMQWAHSIRAALSVLTAGEGKTVIATELAVADGNWRDLVEQVRFTDSSTPTPIVLLTPSSTAELWWDALECGIDDILHGCLIGSRLCQLLERYDEG